MAPLSAVALDKAGDNYGRSARTASFPRYFCASILLKCVKDDTKCRTKRRLLLGLYASSDELVLAEFTISNGHKPS